MRYLLSLSVFLRQVEGIWCKGVLRRLTSHTIIALLYFLILSACGTDYTSSMNRYRNQAISKSNNCHIYINPRANKLLHQKIAIIPLRAPVELAGSSVADMVATELLGSGLYRLVERGQMEKILGEQALGLKGITDSSTAVQLGKILGVQGVIVGTVPEYGYKAIGSNKVPAIGINLRMINVQNGNIVWSLTTSGISSDPSFSLSSYASFLVNQAISELGNKLREKTSSIPPPITTSLIKHTLLLSEKQSTRLLRN